MQRYAICFRVRPGSEETVAGFLASYASPNWYVDEDTRLVSTSVFMHGNLVVRLIEIEGDFRKVVSHLSQDPNISDVERKIQPYLAEGEERDLSSPDGAREFFRRAMMRTITTRYA